MLSAHTASPAPACRLSVTSDAGGIPRVTLGGRGKLAPPLQWLGVNKTRHRPMGLGKKMDGGSSRSKMSKSA